MTIEHSPTPWRTQLNERGLRVLAGYKVIADIEPWEDAKTNAEFIVRAVNCHEELVAALERMVDYLDFEEVPEDAEGQYEQALAALAKARGQVESREGGEA